MTARAGRSGRNRRTFLMPLSKSPFSRDLVRPIFLVLLAVFTLGWAGVSWWGSASAEPAVVIPPPVADASPAADDQLQTAVLAGGCFWGVQAVFQHTTGVHRALSGY